MPQPAPFQMNLAVLIDGDNAQYKFMPQILEEVSRHGTVTNRRAYGDWTQPNLAPWRDVMLANAIHPVQQWRYTTGKNATDSALIIDAMDILYSGTVQGFCIVSSDSDYTRLCTRIRESGLFVMGIGAKPTPEAFIKACDVFVYVENLNPAQEKSLSKASSPDADAKKNKQLLELLSRAFDIIAPEDEWVHLGALGQALQRIDPSFDSRTYGYKTLSLLAKSLPKYLEMKDTKKTGNSSIYVRLIEQ
ncbi:MAG: Maebl [Phototrophicales bacterium]|jgi:uncharacterized LabA/DUF88 family protein|nr:MAG: Maebl [Phototrophicales bacterium]